MKARLLAAALAMSMISFGPAIAAQQRVTTLRVTTKVASSCTVSSQNTLDFVNYDPTSATDAQAVADLQVTCPIKTAITIGISGAADATANGRTLPDITTGTNPALTFQLYQDSAFTTAWGDIGQASPTPMAVTTSATSTTNDYFIYGDIPAGQSTVVVGDSFSAAFRITVQF